MDADRFAAILVELKDARREHDAAVIRVENAVSDAIKLLGERPAPTRSAGSVPCFDYTPGAASHGCHIPEDVVEHIDACAE